MKKENIYKFLYAVCAVCVLGFFIRLFADYLTYDAALTSAPFYTYVLIRGVEFGFLAAVLFVVGNIFKKKYSGKK